jgi:hypothetical protein
MSVTPETIRCASEQLWNELQTTNLYWSGGDRNVHLFRLREDFFPIDPPQDAEIGQILAYDWNDTADYYHVNSAEDLVPYVEQAARDYEGFESLSEAEQIEALVHATD